MPSLPTLPQRTTLERVSLGLAFGLVALGGLTLLGWWLQLDTLLRPFPNTAALKANAALGFFAVGLALLAIEYGKRAFAPVAIVATLFGLLSLVQDVSNADFRIDQLLVRDHLLVDTLHPGRMSSLVAACLVLGSLVLVWPRSIAPPRRASSPKRSWDQSWPRRACRPCSVTGPGCPLCTTGARIPRRRRSRRSPCVSLAAPCF